MLNRTKVKLSVGGPGVVDVKDCGCGLARCVTDEIEVMGVKAGWIYKHGDGVWNFSLN